MARRRAFRKINDAGLRLIKSFESLELEAYRCAANVLTIGYGHTGAAAKPGAVITEDKADKLLAADAKDFCHAVETAVGDAPTTDNQFSGMVSLAFNIGAANFRKSTVLRRHRAGDYDGAAEAFAMWNKARVDGKLAALRGLTRRRKAEALLYLEPDDDDAAYAINAELAGSRGVEMVEATAARRGSLLQSRTVKGAAGGLAGTATAGLASVADQAHTVLPAARGAFEILADYKVEILTAALVLAAVGCAWALWARYSDHRDGVR